VEEPEQRSSPPHSVPAVIACSAGTVVLQGKEASDKNLFELRTRTAPWSAAAVDAAQWQAAVACPAIGSRHWWTKAEVDALIWAVNAQDIAGVQR
jgi:hypothetical protein